MFSALAPNGNILQDHMSQGDSQKLSLLTVKTQKLASAFAYEGRGKTDSLENTVVIGEPSNNILIGSCS